MANTIADVIARTGPVSFEALAGIGENFGKMRRDQNVAKILSGVPMKDGVIDFGAASRALAQGGYPDISTAYAKMSQNNAMSPYEAASIALRAAGLQQAQEKMNRPRPKTATQMKIEKDAEDQLNLDTGNVEGLKRAQQLLNEGIYEGGLAGAQTELGTKWDYGGVASGLGLVDKDKAGRTSEYMNIMTPEAMTRMATELKGSTAYQELLAYTRVFADPTVPNTVKSQMLGRIIKGYERRLETNKRRAQQYSNAESEEAEATDLAPGAVVDGYTYLGGDPNDPSSWQEQ